MANVIFPFDPWKSPLCTCGKKFSFNPYTGCAHGCLYCYATYISRFNEVRPKKNLFPRLEKDLSKLPQNALISMSNSSDPYPPLEKEFGITRKAIFLIKERGIKLLILTKSHLVVRDIDLLKEMRCAVCITITTLDEGKARVLERGAPSPLERLFALQKLKESGIKVVLRLDPIIPFLTEKDAVKVLYACRFVDHVVTSTLKLRRDSFRRLARAFPELKERYKELYFRRGEKIQNSWYLPKDVRVGLLLKVAKACEELGLSYGFCREGFNFNASSCDGAHLI